MNDTMGSMPIRLQKDLPWIAGEKTLSAPGATWPTNYPAYLRQVFPPDNDTPGGRNIPKIPRNIYIIFLERAQKESL